MGSVPVKEKEEILEILRNAVPADLACGNSYGSCYNGLEVRVDYPAGTFSDADAAAGGREPVPVYADSGRGYQDARTYRFPADKIPQFIRERLGITDEDIRLESSSGGY